MKSKPANPHYIADANRKDNEDPQWVEFRGAPLGNTNEEHGGNLGPVFAIASPK